jgi:ribosomal protein S19E (S16A)
MPPTSATATAPTKALSSASVILDAVKPCKGSVRLKQGANAEKNPILTDVYLLRANAAIARKLPEGHVPTKVRVTVDVLESMPESSIIVEEKK